jgi:hypothetical protein
VWQIHIVAMVSDESCSHDRTELQVGIPPPEPGQHANLLQTNEGVLTNRKFTAGLLLLFVGGCVLATAAAVLCWHSWLALATLLIAVHLMLLW